MPLEVLLSLEVYMPIFIICENKVVECKFINTDFKDITFDLVGTCQVIIYLAKSFNEKIVSNSQRSRKKYKIKTNTLVFM